MSTPAFPYLLMPSVWASRNRARRRERGDLTRGLMFGAIGILGATRVVSGGRRLAARKPWNRSFRDYRASVW